MNYIQISTTKTIGLQQHVNSSHDFCTFPKIHDAVAPIQLPYTNDFSRPYTPNSIDVGCPALFLPRIEPQDQPKTWTVPQIDCA